jgi:hypothetical protein
MLKTTLLLCVSLQAYQWIKDSRHPIERMDKNKIYEYRYYDEVAFLKNFVGYHWQCIPC